MLTGMLLHQVKTSLNINGARNLLSDLQGLIAQMNDPSIPIRYIQYMSIIQGSDVASLPAALGIESSGVESHSIAPFYRPAVGDIGRKRI
jgi:hypothetical protein